MTKTLTAAYGGCLIKQVEFHKRPLVYVKNTKTNASDSFYISDKRVCSTATQLRRYLKYLLSTDKLQSIQKSKNDDDCCNVAVFDDDYE